VNRAAGTLASEESTFLGSLVVKKRTSHSRALRSSGCTLLDFVAPKAFSHQGSRHVGLECAPLGLNIVWRAYSSPTLDCTTLGAPMGCGGPSSRICVKPKMWDTQRTKAQGTPECIPKPDEMAKAQAPPECIPKLRARTKGWAPNALQKWWARHLVPKVAKAQRAIPPH